MSSVMEDALLFFFCSKVRIGVGVSLPPKQTYAFDLWPSEGYLTYLSFFASCCSLQDTYQRSIWLENGWKAR